MSRRGGGSGGDGGVVGKKIGKAYYTKSQCLMEIAGTAAHEARDAAVTRGGRGGHVRRSPTPRRSRAAFADAAAAATAVVMCGVRRRCASCDIACRRIVTTRSGIQIALLAVSPTLFFSAATKGRSLCNRCALVRSRARRRGMTSNGKNVRWTSYRALVGFRRGSLSQERF